MLKNNVKEKQKRRIIRRKDEDEEDEERITLTLPYKLMYINYLYNTYKAHF